MNDDRPRRIERIRALSRQIGGRTAVKADSSTPKDN
jgi:hypothetical protein